MSRRVVFYTRYDRIWHWAQAVGIVLLLLSGFHIHYPVAFPVMGSLTWAVTLHEFLGLGLLLNALLGLFYSVTGNTIRQYIPMPLEVTRGVFEQAKYYLWGIFHGARHPFEKTPEKKLNPLQKVTYFFLLTFLLPFQLATGVLLWISARFPEFFDRFADLAVVSQLHTLGSFFFLAFLIVHIYLSTTGETPFALLKEMVTGRGEVHG